MILSGAGIHGDIAGSASQAVAMIQKQSYDFMTLDLELPDHHDAEFLADLRSATRARRLPIIAISGAAASPPEDLNASGRRMIDTLDKPIDPQRLLSAARTAIQARRAKFARVLHVEGDADVRQLVSYTLRTAAETSGVATLEEARRRIDEETFDLVVLNTALPDGSGKELETFLSNRVPFVFFNARRAEGGGTYLLASGLVKSLASCPDLPESLQAWVRCVMKQKPQYFDSQVQHRSPEATDAEPLPLSTPEVAS
jgi:DNA-binding response OmpR family regulator